MIEVIIIISIATLISSLYWNKTYSSYVFKGLQILFYIISPFIINKSFMSEALQLDLNFNIVYTLLFIVVGLEAEHFNIKRWIKEVLFILFMILTLSSHLPVVFSAMILIFLLLMVSKKNRFIDFLNFSILTFSFCLYFSELFGTYINSFDKYVVYHNEFSSMLFPFLFVASFVTLALSMWGYVRSTSVTPLLAQILLMIKFKSSLGEINTYMYIVLALFLAYSIYNFKKFVVKRSLSSSINVLFGLAFFPVLQNIMRSEFELSLVQALILSLILYMIRLFNVEKFRNLTDFKTITIFFTLVNLSYFPLGVTGLSIIDSLATSSLSLELLFVIPLLFISWTILYLSITDFGNKLSFNIWEARGSVKGYAFVLLVTTFILSYLNLSPLFIGSNHSRYLLKEWIPSCCSEEALSNYSFNISLLITIILFTLTIYGLKIFNFKKIWRLKMSYISLLSFSKGPSEIVKESGTSSTPMDLSVFDKIGQSSSFTVVFFILISFAGLLLAILE